MVAIPMCSGITMGETVARRTVTPPGPLVELRAEPVGVGAVREVACDVCSGGERLARGTETGEAEVGVGGCRILGRRGCCKGGQQRGNGDERHQRGPLQCSPC